MLWLAGIGLLIVMGVLLFLALMYISSRMRFVLFDSIVAGTCHVRRYWAARGEPASRYFGFQLLLVLTTVTGFALLGGITALIVYRFGWFRNPGQHLVPLILGGFILLVVLATFAVTAALVSVLTKDFVLPQMALENATVMEAWCRLWNMAANEKKGYAAYVGMKILLAIAAAALTGIAGIIIVLLVLLPAGAVAAIAIFGGRAIGLVWNPLTIAVAIVAGCIVLATIFSGVLLVSVPMIVFFLAYSVYFFAARYPNLSLVLNPPVPPTSTAG